MRALALVIGLTVANFCYACDCSCDDPIGDPIKPPMGINENDFKGFGDIPKYLTPFTDDKSIKQQEEADLQKHRVKD